MVGGIQDILRTSIRNNGSRCVSSKINEHQTTKTGVARTIKMDDKTMAVMKEWKKQQKQDYLVLGFNTMQPKQLVFSNEVNEYLQPTKTRKWILHVQKKYKLGTITTHGLRHYALFTTI